jgi:dihydrodipicolinate synthase/N-acetylneuraminate lyase
VATLPDTLDGIAVALVTLFDRHGELDAPATAAHARRVVDEGARAVVVAGSTGEASALDPDERSTLLAAVREAVGGAVPVVAGTGAPSTRQAVALSRRAADDGADALLVLSPPGESEPRAYYDAVLAAVDLPVIAYHFPKMSTPGIAVDVLRELPVAGIKDSSGDPARLAIELDEMPHGVFVGSAALLLQARAMGCRGAILALANVDIEGCRRAWEGDGAAQAGLIVGHRAGATSGVPGLKRALCQLHGTSPVVRVCL